MKICKTFSDINHTNILLVQSPKAIEIKAKINKWDLIKLIIFCTAKETISKMKRQPIAWEKLFADIFFQSVGCLFILFMVSCAMQKLLNFLRSHLFIFAFISIAFVSWPKKPLENSSFASFYLFQSMFLWLYEFRRNNYLCFQYFLHASCLPWIFVYGVLY